MILELLFWVIIILLFIVSFVGIVFPIIPSVLVLWAGFILYHVGVNSEELLWVFWVAMGVLTLVLFGSDMIANSYFVKKYGGSKWGERVAGISVILGSFVLPPFGLLIVPFVAVFCTEMIQKKTNKEAFFASLGSLVGFLSGSLAKVFIQLLMIGWFLVEVFVF